MVVVVFCIVCVSGRQYITSILKITFSGCESCIWCIKIVGKTPFIFKDGACCVVRLVKCLV